MMSFVNFLFSLNAQIATLCNDLASSTRNPATTIKQQEVQSLRVKFHTLETVYSDLNTKLKSC